jgi:hypothetical protein
MTANHHYVTRASVSPPIPKNHNRHPYENLWSNKNKAQQLVCKLPRSLLGGQDLAKNDTH